MGRQAGHHFIPASYLAGFTEEGRKDSSFTSVSVKTGKSFITSPIKSCKQRDYYTIDEAEDTLLVEKLYANEIEPKIKESLMYIENNSSIPSGELFDGLLLLIATLNLRVPKMRNWIEAPLKQQLEAVANISDFNYKKSDIIKSELKLIEKVHSSLKNKFYALYVADKNSHFVTSDNPFFLGHPQMASGIAFGLDTPKVEICVPINKQLAIVGSNEPISSGTFSADDRFIGLLNTKITANANNFFFSSKSHILLVDRNLTPYSYDLSRGKPTINN